MSVKIKWSNLFNMPELDFEPAPPRDLILSDELSQSLAWLTAATKHDRRLLRCNDDGSLLVTDAWSVMEYLASYRLDPAAGVPSAWICTTGNKGVLISTSTQLVCIHFVKASGGSSEDIFVPPYQYYWYPYNTYSVTAYVVPADTGSASCVGVVAFK